MFKRVAYLLIFYLLTVLLFVVAKVVFMLCNTSVSIFTVSDVFSVIHHGLTLDLSTALYFLIVPFLLIVASLWVVIPRWVYRVYYVITAFVYALVFVADTSLYPFWRFKLDASCLQYLETPGEAMASVSAGYLLLRVLAFLVLTFAIYKFYDILSLPIRRMKHPLVHTLGYVLLIPFIVIGIRGGLDESTTNIGQVYFSQNQFLNHSAVNPVFSFLASFEKTATSIVDYNYYTTEECAQLMDGLYPTSSENSKRLLTMQQPDIVVILMESAGELMADVMPRLQQLKREGVNFSNCYGNTWRTDRGTVCAYSGYPSFPTSSVMKMPSKTQHLPSLARSLQRAGYSTSYFYGGDINFTNMRSYLVGTGFEELTWKKDYSTAEQQTSEWGVRDGIVFQSVYQKLTAPHEQPLLIGFSTLSSHQPWDVPVHHVSDTIKNAFYYLDDCIGHFIDQLRQSPQWHRTLVVLLPDHSIDYGDLDESRQERNRIPMVWTGGAVARHEDIPQICNQTDLAATLLSQLGLPHEEFRWSRDVLSDSYRYPFAVHNFNNGFSIVDSTGFIVYDLDSSRLSVNNSTDAQRLVRMGKAILQATTNDLKDMQ